MNPFGAFGGFCRDGLGRKFVKFLLAGLPSFLVALPLNWFLVEKLSLNPPVSYAIVLFLQVTVNFFLCRVWVFDATRKTSLVAQYFAFVGGIAFFRLADWGLYVLLVEVFGFYYLAVQLFNIVVFAFLKFGFSRRIMEA